MGVQCRLAKQLSRMLRCLPKKKRIPIYSNHPVLITGVHPLFPHKRKRRRNSRKIKEIKW
jgi:hypothetical protein